MLIYVAVISFVVISKTNSAHLVVSVRYLSYY